MTTLDVTEHISTLLKYIEIRIYKSTTKKLLIVKIASHFLRKSLFTANDKITKILFAESIDSQNFDTFIIPRVIQKHSQLFLSRGMIVFQTLFTLENIGKLTTRNW